MQSGNLGGSNNWSWGNVPNLNPNNAGVLNGPGGGGGQNQITGQNMTQESGGTYFGLPDVAKGIAGDVSGVIGQQAGQYNQFVTDPFASPITNNAITGYLAGLTNSENLARQNLSDQFRGAGNMSSSIFGNAAQNLEGDILQKRFSGVSDIVSKLYPQIAQAMFNPLSLGPSTIDATKLQQNQKIAQGYTAGTSPSSGGAWAYSGGAGNGPGGIGGLQKLY